MQKAIEKYRHVVVGVVRKVARKIPSGRVQREDLEAAGMFGLVDALQRRSDLSGEDFERYLWTRVRGAVIDELRRHDWASRRVRARIRREEGVTGPFVVPVESETLERLATSDGEDCPYEAAERRSAHAAIVNALEALPVRERDIVRMHYLESVPLGEVARRMNVTPARISQLHARALGALRERCRSRSTRPPQYAPKVGAVDARVTRRQRHVSSRPAQLLPQVGLVEKRHRPLLGDGVGQGEQRRRERQSVRSRSIRPGMSRSSLRPGFERQVGGLDHVARAQDEGTLHGVLELANVPRPSVSEQGSLRSLAESLLGPVGPAGELSEKMLGQDQDVLAAIA